MRTPANCCNMVLLQLEFAGWAGFFIVCAMTLTILVQAIYHGMPYAGRVGERRTLNFLCMPQIPAAVASCGGLTMSASPILAYEGSGVNHMLGSHHINVAESHREMGFQGFLPSF